MHKTFRKLIAVLVLASALIPVILIAVPSGQAATICDGTHPCLPESVSFANSIPTGGAAFLCGNVEAGYCLAGHGPNGVGVYGSSGTNSSDYGGVFGVDTAGSQAVGVKGFSNNGYGGYFTATGSDGYGIHASGVSRGVDASSTSGYGVFGLTGSSFANAAGVSGAITSGADYAAGVRGQNFSASCCGFGVVGFHAGQGIGIGGYAPNGFGVFGWSPNNWAAWLDGAVTITKDLHVNGTLYKGAGAFRIDNPLDPAHSYLQHSFVESPDMKNIYDGVVRTNARGYATVTLPKWFQALNKDFRYQLTSLSGLQDVAVAKEIHDNRFVIQSQKPRSRVSWQVTGIRHDPYANANRIQPVIPKTGRDAGKYEHPRLYNQPASKGVTALPADLEYSKQAAAAPQLNKK